MPLTIEREGDRFDLTVTSADRGRFLKTARLHWSPARAPREPDPRVALSFPEREAQAVREPIRLLAAAGAIILIVPSASVAQEARRGSIRPW